jgi:hypothetical protein
MLGILAPEPRNRTGRRVAVESFCTELCREQVRHALVVDLSEQGLRIQRPLGGRMPWDLQLEFEVPEVDEIVWARGRVRFDRVERLPRNPDGTLAGIVRTTGIQIVSFAERHRRLLREYIMDANPPPVPSDDDWLAYASCYARG